jgi:hypothetical protein
VSGPHGRQRQDADQIVGAAFEPADLAGGLFRIDWHTLARLRPVTKFVPRVGARAVPGETRRANEGVFLNVRELRKTMTVAPG